MWGASQGDGSCTSELPEHTTARFSSWDCMGQGCGAVRGVGATRLLETGLLSLTATAASTQSMWGQQGRLVCTRLKASHPVPSPSGALEHQAAGQPGEAWAVPDGVDDNQEPGGDRQAVLWATAPDL